MEEKTKRLFEDFEKHGYQSDYITFSMFKKLLNICKERGVDTFYYSKVTHGFGLSITEESKKYLKFVEFTYEDGINCLNDPPPDVFKDIIFHFFPESDAEFKKKKKKETKQVTF